ncbi:MAG: GGDEF domain-containing protein [Gallionella sp.]|nr:GGDEF domain-containing protein [Gallionella sp.]
MTNRKRLLFLSLIVTGYLIIILAVVGTGSVASRNAQELGTITQEIYAHPFAVSHAASHLKAAFLQEQNSILQMVLVRSSKQTRAARAAEIAAIDQEIQVNLQVIRENFLGDMSKVDELESNFQQWVVIRARIFEMVERGDFVAAQNLTRREGTAKFNQIAELYEYVQEYAQDKAKRYADASIVTTENIVHQTNLWLTSLIFVVVITAVIVFWRVLGLQNELRQQATIDFLTGVPNRRYFMEIAERELKRSQRYGNPFALAVIDLDLFKSVNDTYGHSVGDKVLKRFCELCKAALRDTDTFGRIGGEEFAILLPDTELAKAQEVMERIRNNIELAVTEAEQGVTLKFTASFGLTTSEIENVQLLTLFRFADEALYAAKNSGRNRVCIYQVQPH